jgi:hypothetical protein
LKRDRHRQQHGIEAAKKLNVIQPVTLRLKAEATRLTATGTI